MIFANIWRLITGHWQDNHSASSPDVTPDTPGSSQTRALVWLGKDRLERQYFYEQWACHENWNIYNQGIPLLLGRDPDDPALPEDLEFVQQRQELWQHLQKCVERRVSPQLKNPAETAENWQAEPVEIYRWAIAARLDIPEELDGLLSFISMTISPSSIVNQDDNTSGEWNEENLHVLAREQVLSAMLSLCLQAYHQSSGDNAETIRDFVLNNIYAKSERFFGQDEPPLSRPALHDLIDRSLEMTGLIHIPG